MTDRAISAAIAARDLARAVIVLARLAEGPATNAELRRATGYPGDSFRSLLRRLQARGLIVAVPSPRWRWALPNSRCIIHSNSRGDAIVQERVRRPADRLATSRAETTTITPKLVTMTTRRAIGTRASMQ